MFFLRHPPPQMDTAHCQEELTDTGGLWSMSQDLDLSWNVSTKKEGLEFVLSSHQLA